MKSEHSRKMRRFEELLKRERKMERRRERRKREAKAALLEVLVDKGYPAQDILDLLDLFDKEVSL